MTDNSSWQAPGADSPQRDASTFPASPTGDRPQYGPAQPAAAPLGPAQSPGASWAPPPKPGLVPLRPLGFGTLLGASFQVLRRNPKASFGSALLIQATTVIVTLLVVGLATFWGIERIANARPEEEDLVAAGSIAGIIAAALVPVLLSFAATALLQGIIVLEVARGTLGEKLTLGSLWRLAVRRLWPLVLWTLLYSGAVIVAVAIVGLVVVVLVLQGSALIVVGVLLGLALGAGLVVLFFWLFTKLSLTPSVIVLEKSRVVPAMRRSWGLTHGYFWRTLGVQLLVAVIVQVAVQVVTTPVTLIFGLGTGLFFPTGPQSDTDPMAVVGPALLLNGVLLVFTVIFGAIGAVAQAASAALIYIDLRMRKEGLDLELVRFVEKRSSGRYGTPANDLPNPYETTRPVAGPGGSPRAAGTNGSPWG